MNSYNNRSKGKSKKISPVFFVALMAVLAVFAVIVSNGGFAAAATGGEQPQHTNNVTATCEKLTVNLTSYNAGNSQQTNTIKVTIGTDVVENTTFESSFSKQYPVAYHTNTIPYKVEVVAWDDPNGNNGWTFTKTGNIPACPITPTKTFTPVTPTLTYTPITPTATFTASYTPNTPTLTPSHTATGSATPTETSTPTGTQTPTATQPGVTVTPTNTPPPEDNTGCEWINVGAGWLPNVGQPVYMYYLRADGTFENIFQPPVDYIDAMKAFDTNGDGTPDTAGLELPFKNLKTVSLGIKIGSAMPTEGGQFDFLTSGCSIIVPDPPQEEKPCVECDTYVCEGMGNYHGAAVWYSDQGIPTANGPLDPAIQRYFIWTEVAFTGGTPHIDPNGKTWWTKHRATRPEMERIYREIGGLRIYTGSCGICLNLFGHAQLPDGQVVRWYGYGTNPWETTVALLNEQGLTISRENQDAINVADAQGRLASRLFRAYLAEHAHIPSYGWLNLETGAFYTPEELSELQGF